MLKRLTSWLFLGAFFAAPIHAADLSYGNKYAVITPAGALMVDQSYSTAPVKGVGTFDVNCVSGCSGSSSASSVGVTTVTFNGSAQPVTVGNFPATQPVSGSFWQNTQPVSLASMPTTPVTGSFWQATQPVSGSFWQATQPVSGTFWPATQPVSGSVSISNFPTSQSVYVTNPTTTTITGTVPVSGSFWQTTQPVSIASMPTTPVTGSFFQATQPVSVASMPTTPVTGTFFQATQPVSIASMPSTPVTGTFWQATQPVSGTVTAAPQAATLSVSSAGVAGSAITASVPAVASSFHYITLIEITAYTTVARVGGVTPVTVTTSNLPGSPSYTFASAAAVGSTDVKTYVFNQPFKSTSSNTASTIVCPATASVIWRVNIYYYAAL